MKFFICEHCGNIVAYARNNGVPIACCGEEMKELKPNTVDASVEKHVPLVTLGKNKITIDIGSAPHPMTAEHYIMWVAIETKEGNQRKELSPDNDPKVEFMICDSDSFVAAYAYCNLHGLWKS